MVNWRKTKNKKKLDFGRGREKQGATWGFLRGKGVFSANIEEICDSEKLKINLFFRIGKLLWFCYFVVWVKIDISEPLNFLVLLFHNLQQKADFWILFSIQNRAKSWKMHLAYGITRK